MKFLATVSALAATASAAPCKCVGIGNNHGVDVKNYGSDYGAVCNTWDLNLKYCLPGGDYAGASWCKDAWCYTNQDCDTAKHSDFFPGADLYFSYDHCGSIDSFSGTGIGVGPLSCTTDLKAGENLFTLSEKWNSDWLTTWSLNNAALDSQPDGRSVGQYVRYAKPYLVSAGETANEIASRFGISVQRLAETNPGVAVDESLQKGQVLCVIPNWASAINRMGQKVCSV